MKDLSLVVIYQRLLHSLEINNKHKSQQMCLTKRTLFSAIPNQWQEQAFLEILNQPPNNPSSATTQPKKKKKKNQALSSAPHPPAFSPNHQANPPNQAFLIKNPPKDKVYSPFQTTTTTRPLPSSEILQHKIQHQQQQLLVVVSSVNQRRFSVLKTKVDNHSSALT